MYKRQVALSPVVLLWGSTVAMRKLIAKNPHEIHTRWNQVVKKMSFYSISECEIGQNEKMPTSSSRQYNNRRNMKKPVTVAMIWT